jgi:hypothetical protein
MKTGVFILVNSLIIAVIGIAARWPFPSVLVGWIIGFLAAGSAYVLSEPSDSI